MPGFGNPSNQLRVALRNPSKHEERCPDSSICKKFEQPVRIGHDARRPLAPIGTVDGPGQCLDLEVVLDIERDCVPHGISRKPGPGYCSALLRQTSRKKTLFSSYSVDGFELLRS